MADKEDRNPSGASGAGGAATPPLSQQIVDAMNARRWRDATFLLIAKVDELYQASPAGASGAGGAATPSMTDAAEMLWVVLANVSGGDWTLQSAEWQEAAARWRDNYFAALKAQSTPSPAGAGEVKEKK